MILGSYEGFCFYLELSLIEFVEHGLLEKLTTMLYKKRKSPMLPQAKTHISASSPIPGNDTTRNGIMPMYIS